MQRSTLYILAVLFVLFGTTSCGVVKKKLNRTNEKTSVDSVDRSTLDQTTLEITKGDSITHVPEDSLKTTINLKKEDTTTSQTVESGGMELTITATKKKNGDTQIDVKAKTKAKDIKTGFTKTKKTTTKKKNNVRVRKKKKQKETVRDTHRDNRLNNIALIGGSLIIVLFLGWYFIPKLKSYFKNNI